MSPLIGQEVASFDWLPESMQTVDNSGHIFPVINICRFRVKYLFKKKTNTKANRGINAHRVIVNTTQIICRVSISPCLEVVMNNSSF